MLFTCFFVVVVAFKKIFFTEMLVYLFSIYSQNFFFFLLSTLRYYFEGQKYGFSVR